MSIANLKLLQRRAELKAQLRAYLSQAQILEVDVPVLGKNACPDNAVHPIGFSFRGATCYLQPSPEMFLKRILAEHPVDCYSLGPVFRDDPTTSIHNPEFMMLEFYLVGSNRYQELIDKTVSIAKIFVGERPVQILNYEAVWLKVLNQPYQADKSYFTALLDVHSIDYNPAWDCAVLEDLAFGTLCQPKLGNDVFTVISGFPKEQAALARCEQDGLASRFEVFIDGFEIANGYDELIDEAQNRNRFDHWNKQRFLQGLPYWPADEKFLSAIAKVPSCSGVAIGLERLIMLALQQPSLANSMLISWEEL